MRFTFSVGISLGVHEDLDSFFRRQSVSLKAIAAEFSDHSPVFTTEAVTFETDDPAFGFRLFQRAQEQGIQDVCVSETSVWKLEDLFRSRFVPLHAEFGRESILCDPDGHALNRFEPTLCDECGWYDESAVPTELLVLGRGLESSVEIYSGFHGRVIVSERVLEILKAAVQPDELEIGRVEIVGEKKSGAESALFWVRPTHESGPEPQVICTDPCRKCGTPRRCYYDDSRGGLSGRVVVPEFPKENRVSRLGSWVGGRGDQGSDDRCLDREVIISGELLALLLAYDAKWLLIPEAGVFSVSGEPVLQEADRFGAILSGVDLKKVASKYRRRKRFR